MYSGTLPNISDISIGFVNIRIYLGGELVDAGELW